MKIALKYGLLITLGVIAWVVVTHLLVPDPRSPVHNLGAGVFFNLLEIAGIYLAINTTRNESGGQLSFKSGVKTGVWRQLCLCGYFLFVFSGGDLHDWSKIDGERTECESSAALEGSPGSFCWVGFGGANLRSDLFDGDFFLPR